MTKFQPNQTEADYLNIFEKAHSYYKQEEKHR